MAPHRVLIARFGAAALALSLIGCLDPCGNAIRSEVASPDGKKRAVVFERSCGATTPFSAHVSVLDRGEKLPQSSGNVFDADGDHGAVRDVTVTVFWTSRNELLLRYPAAARVYVRNEQVNGVAIKYETVP